MELSKLKIDQYKGIHFFNFPEAYDLDVHEGDQPIDVIIYYIDQLSDIEDFVRLVRSSKLPKDNRTIMVYKKGRRDGLNRDSIYKPFKEGTYEKFKMRRPALCSLSNDLSAFVQSWEG